MRFTELHSKMRICNFDVQKLESRNCLLPLREKVVRSAG